VNVVDTKNKKCVELRVSVFYDPEKTDDESIATAMDILVETAISTPGIWDDYGEVGVGAFTVAPDYDCEAKNFAPDADAICFGIGDWEISIGKLEDGDVHVDATHPETRWSAILGKEGWTQT
jgi:hypothetical protein